MAGVMDVRQKVPAKGARNLFQSQEDTVYHMSSRGDQRQSIESSRQRARLQNVETSRLLAAGPPKGRVFRGPSPILCRTTRVMYALLDTHVTRDGG